MKPTTKTSRKPKLQLATQQVIALHVDLVTEAFRSLPADIFPSGAIEINPGATEDELKSIIKFTHQEATIGSTFRFYMEGDVWTQIQQRIGKRKGISFLIDVFGEELGRRLYWRYRFRGSIAVLVPIYARDYTMTQREILASVGQLAQINLAPKYSDVHIILNDNGQTFLDFDHASKHHSVPIPAEELTKAVQSVLQE